MKKQRFLVHGILVSAALLASGCDFGPDQYGDINISSNIEAADGLDLRAVGELVKKAESAEDLEKLLNQNHGVNNLDLDADGKVDFIHVTEYGEGSTRGFSLTVEPEEGETQEIATIEVEQKDDQADVYVQGNEQVYGPHHHYHYGMPLGSMLLMAYLFRPHPLYISPFHYGYYPGYYGVGYRRVSPVMYQTRTRTLRNASTAKSVSTPRSPSITSPNKGRSASKGIRASLRNPSKSQRAFRSRATAPRSTRGFAERVRSRGSSMRGGTSRRAFGSSRSRGGFGFGRGFRSGGFRSRR